MTCELAINEVSPEGPSLGSVGSSVSIADDYPNEGGMGGNCVGKCKRGFGR